MITQNCKEFDNSYRLESMELPFTSHDDRIFLWCWKHPLMGFDTIHYRFSAAATSSFRLLLKSFHKVNGFSPRIMGSNEFSYPSSIYNCNQAALISVVVTFGEMEPRPIDCTRRKSSHRVEHGVELCASRRLECRWCVYGTHGAGVSHWPEGYLRLVTLWEDVWNARNSEALARRYLYLEKRIARMEETQTAREGNHWK